LDPTDFASPQNSVSAPLAWPMTMRQDIWASRFSRETDAEEHWQMPDEPDNLVLQPLRAVRGDIADIRDDLRVLSAIVMRLDTSQSAILDELRATRAQITRMNDRVRKLEDSE
jgi:hypothetical protein